LKILDKKMEGIETKLMDTQNDILNVAKEVVSNGEKYDEGKKETGKNLSRIEKSIQIGRTATTIAKKGFTAYQLAAGIGTGGASVVIPWVASVLWRRRRRRKSITQTPSVVGVPIDSPPPPQHTGIETHYVSYEKDTFAEAQNFAEEQFVRKYPGAVASIEVLKSFRDQYLSSVRSRGEG
jgi:hypothetical protein